MSGAGFKNKKTSLVLGLALSNTCFCKKSQRAGQRGSDASSHRNEERETPIPLILAESRKLPRITKKNRAALCTICNHGKRHCDETRGSKNHCICNGTE